MTTTLRALLEQAHASWKDELESVLVPARRSDAGPWARWAAIRYLEQVFPARVRWERGLVERVSARLSDAEQTRLWALGELLVLLPTYVGHLSGLCHRAGEFENLTDRLVLALGGWCRAMEEALGPLPVNSLSENEVAEMKKDSLRLQNGSGLAGRC